MNSKQLFEIALGDISPWQVVSIDFEIGESGNKELHIRLDFPAGSTFLDDLGVPCKAHDTNDHTWRHLNFFEHHCYLHARVPRIKDSGGSVKTVQVPWARRNTGFTLLFEAFAMSLIELEMPVLSVARLVGERDQRIWNIFKHYVRKARANTDYTGIQRVGMDETSFRRGHDYVTVGVDLDTTRVFDVTEGKDQYSVAVLAAFLDENGSPSEAVEQVSIDMSPAFIAGCYEYLPNAAITFDHFHVTKVVNKAMDDLRRIERQECSELKNHKYTLLKNSDNLSDKKFDELLELITLYPKLGEGYRLKELLREFWNFNDIKMAEKFLKDWCKQADKSGIFPFQKAANTIRAHWSGILNYVKSKINNGILEGINSKIQLAKRRARGYRNKDNFMNMILFTCGKLNFKHSPI
ncbi:MAG: ISL3 family transposase [Thermodesulfovibrionia bacterium]|nr:ISL3 family transposase [Thermodesulfovibrionia bacterium]